MEVYFFTNKGKKRKHNEDSLLVLDEILTRTDMEKCGKKELKELKGILAVADGMGGHAKGEVASFKTLEVLLKESKNIKTEEDLKKVLNKARDVLEEIAQEDWTAHGLGTTLAGMVLMGDRALAFNVGDCRVYRFNGEKVERITKDHSLVEELVDRGEITREEVRRHPYRNIVTSAVIGDGYSTPLRVFVREVELQKGEKYLICSDGFWEEFEEEEMEKLLRKKDFCENTLRELENKPQRDNVSFILLDLRN